MPPLPPPAVLVIGTGYLAQFVLKDLHEKYVAEPVGGISVSPEHPKPHISLHATFRSAASVLENLPDAVSQEQMDLFDPRSVSGVLNKIKPAVIINCAAITSLRECADSEEDALKANAPAALVAAMEALPWDPLLVQLSSDQVYDGAEAPYEDSSPQRPINVYGRTKKACEDMLRHSAVRCVVLRSSNILGPPSPYTGTGKFLQWLRGELARACEGDTVVRESVTLFHDEFRNFIWVEDICCVANRIVEDEVFTGEPVQSFGYNMGGPERLSRVDVGMRVCAAFGYDSAAIAPIERYGDPPHPSAAGNPQDISMISDNLVIAFRVRRTPIGVAIRRWAALQGARDPSTKRQKTQ